MSLDYFIPDAFFGNTELSQINASQFGSFGADEVYIKTSRYFNYTGKIVTVIERSGTPFEFAAIPSYNRADFVIVTDWKIHKSMHLALVNYFKHERENESKTIRQLRELITKYEPTIRDQFIFLRTEEKITLADLEKHRNEIYVHDHDVVVSLFRGIEAGPHPYSSEGRAIDLTTMLERGADKKAFCEMIKIVDNSGRFGDRFINRNKNVYRIEASQDASREDGVWVVRNKPFENTRLPATMGWRRYTFEEADEILELYKTYAEAEHCGDAEYKKKQELLTLEARLTRDKTEFSEQKLTHQREQHNWEVERVRLTTNFERQQAAYADEQFRAKMDLDRQKNFYERQMLDIKSNYERRKDVGDWLKQVPAVLGAIAVAWLTYKTASLAARRGS
jgi:hypothetical protein